MTAGRRQRQPVRVVAALAALVAVVGVLTVAPASAAPPPSRPAAADLPVPAASAAVSPGAVPPAQRTAVLGRDWDRSTDLAWATTGDGDGFHLLVADERSGYRWRTAATLSEPALEADSWIGNACLTASGRRAVVVYAPRAFTNKAHLFDRGGFTAVVDLVSGKVTKLPVTTSLAYFNPGCGAGEAAVLTQAGDQDLGRTRLIRLDAATGALGARIEVPGELTSAVPTADGGIVAAESGSLDSVDARGVRRVLAPTAGVPFKVAADADGGVTYLERAGTDRVAAKRVALATRRVSTLATGALTGVDVTSGRGGRVFVTGTGRPAAAVRSVPVLAVPVGSRVSTEGRLAISEVVRETQPDPRAPVADPGAARAVTIRATALSTGRPVTLSARPDTPEQGTQGGRTPSPATPKAASRRTTGGPTTSASPTGPADLADRYCSVPRNDPANQAMQPKPRQVEWAVDQAVRGALTVSRPANWKNLGMPAYTPQGLFPSRALSGGGSVPAQVMLGIAAQESNLWQAARFAVPGVTANPLIGNYYGVDVYNSTAADDWTINWADADCGYGVTQLTDGMRLAGRTKPGETALPFQTQRAVALDFAANVAGGVQKLQDKWNETRSAGLTINNGDPARIENWFYAVWAYNSGFYPNTGGPWGVGWTNNPANPKYPANRGAFLDHNDYADAAEPQLWPYPEKVMGWAAWPIQALESPGTFVAGYRAAYWNGDVTTADLRRTQVAPPVNQFCVPAMNQCYPGQLFTPNDPGSPAGGKGDVRGEPAGPCAHRNSAGLYDLKCWANGNSTWKADCAASCGYELLRFNPGYAYQDDGTAYPPKCDLGGLPAGAQIVDDVPTGTPIVRPNCSAPFSNAGTFTLTYKPDGVGQYPGKIDTHQIGGGFAGHFWFTHTRTATDNGGKLEVNASWKLNTSRTGPMRVLVALPDHGAQTNNASYVVKTANGDRVRTVAQAAGSGNRWFNLGAFQFNGIPEVRLSSVAADGDGSRDIAFDAVAFVPIAGTYKEQSVEAVGESDENQNIDTSGSTSWLGGYLANRTTLYDWAVRRSTAIKNLPACTGAPTGTCVPAAVKTMAQTWYDQVVAAGTDPVNHPLGKSIGNWIGFTQPYTDRPTSAVRPAWFSDDSRIKVRSKATVSYVLDGNNKIVSGSEYAVYEHRTGNTHLAKFVRDLMSAVRTGYGQAPPDMRYRMQNLNAHDGSFTSVDPVATGLLPGRAYAYAGRAPTPVDSTGAPSATNATCVATLFTSGGSIGYRPYLANTGPAQNWTTYVQSLDANAAVPQAVVDLAEDTRVMFFANGLVPAGLPGGNQSVFVQAPPVWQELAFKACADGSVRPVSGVSLLRSSWMPDQYLYHNGTAMTLTGAGTSSAQPVVRADFGLFSRAPDPNQDFPLWANSYGPCGAATDRSGNPWNITTTPLPDAGTDPSPAHFCLDATLPVDPPFSS